MMMGNKIIAEKTYFAAARILEQRDFNAIPSAAALKGHHSFSNEFEAKISEIFFGADSSSARRRTIGRVMLIAAIIALLLAFEMSYSALRHRTYELLTLQTHEYTDVDFLPVYTDDDARTSVCCCSNLHNEQDYLKHDIELSVHYEVSQLPDGYKEHDRIESPTNCMTVYSNKNAEFIIFQQFIIDSSFRINTENADTTVLSADGITFCCTERRGSSVLLWEQEGYAFTLDCPFSSEDAIKIARSIVVQ